MGRNKDNKIKAEKMARKITIDQLKNGKLNFIIFTLENPRLIYVDDKI